METVNTITKEKFIDLMTKVATSVYDFHTRFDIKAFDSDDNYEGDKLFFNRRILLGLEELGELCSSINKCEPMDDSFLEAIDSLYISMGTALVMGQWLEEACYGVVNKNDKKNPLSYKVDYYEVA